MIEDHLRIIQTAAYFDLSDIEDRRRSNRCLIDLFFDLQIFIRPKTFIEIGAFDASFSRRAREHHPTAKVIAYEANPYNHAHFMKHIDFAKQRIDYRHLAISNRNGTAEFQVQKRKSGVEVMPMASDNSLYRRSATEGQIEYETVVVPAARLDAELSDAHFATDDFSLWVDIEGAAQPFLEGAEKILHRVQSIFIEVEERPYWSDQWLFSHVTAALRPYGFRPIARDYENNHQFNVIFIHERAMAHYLFSDRMMAYVNRIARKL